MKKILGIIILGLLFSNVSYASFPVTENTQIDVVELIESPNYGNSQPVWRS